MKRDQLLQLQSNLSSLQSETIDVHHKYNIDVVQMIVDELVSHSSEETTV